MAKTKGFVTYRTYAFTDKDPMIDKIGAIVSDSGKKFSQISDDTGVSSQTLRNWFNGATCRPQFATLNAVASGLGHELQLVPSRGHNSGVTPRKRNGRPRVQPTRSYRIGSNA